MKPKAKTRMASKKSAPDCIRTRPQRPNPQKGMETPRACIAEGREGEEQRGGQLDRQLVGGGAGGEEEDGLQE